MNGDSDSDSSLDQRDDEIRRKLLMSYYGNSVIGRASPSSSLSQPEEGGSVTGGGYGISGSASARGDAESPAAVSALEEVSSLSVAALERARQLH